MQSKFTVWRLETLEGSARPTTQRRLAEALSIEPEDPCRQWGGEMSEDEERDRERIRRGLDSLPSEGKAAVLAGYDSWGRELFNRSFVDLTWEEQLQVVASALLESQGFIWDGQHFVDYQPEEPEE